MKTVHVRYDLSDYNTPAAVTALQAADEAADGSGISNPETHGPEWFGFNNWGGDGGASQLAAICAHGDRKLTACAQEMLRDAQDLAVPAAFDIKPRWRTRRATGSRFDLERVLSGDPLPWGRWERSKGAGNRIVSLIVNVGGSSAMSATEMMWRPIAGIVIADLLESSGYRVEIIGATATAHDSDVRLITSTELKRADQPVDLNALARICHAAVARGVIYPIGMVTHPKLVDHGSYGRVVDADESDFPDSQCVAVRAARHAKLSIAEIKRVVSLFQ